jgi:fructokinase
MSFNVVGIGELLWDVFPEWRRMGGAPVNFACHCRQLGARGIPVSSVGDDEEGRDLVRAVSALGLETDYLQVCREALTGTVQVRLDADGKPVYQIREGVAWDFIRLQEPLRLLAPAVDAVCFGTLAQRGETSRNTIQRFVELCPATALKIHDVNLRQSFFSRPLIESSLRLANVLKVSDEELPVLASFFDLRGDVVDQLRRLMERFSLRLVAYTRGANGSMLVTPDALADHPGCKPRAIDTVGAGDSYTATLCMGLLRKRPLAEVIRHASEVAAFVCEQPGATPRLPEHLVRDAAADLASARGA